MKHSIQKTQGDNKSHKRGLHLFAAPLAGLMLLGVGMSAQAGVDVHAPFTSVHASSHNDHRSARHGDQNRRSYSHNNDRRYSSHDRRSYDHGRDNRYNQRSHYRNDGRNDRQHDNRYNQYSSRYADHRDNNRRGLFGLW